MCGMLTLSAKSQPQGRENICCILRQAFLKQIYKFNSVCQLLIVNERALPKT